MSKRQFETRKSDGDDGASSGVGLREARGRRAEAAAPLIKDIPSLPG